MKLDIKKYELFVANKCITEKELSKICGVSRSTISQIKKVNREPMPQTIGKIAKALGVSVKDLINE